MTPLENVLAKARDSLIDKTLKNRLLNFKSTKRRTLHIPEVVPQKLYRGLVTNEKAIRLISKEADSLDKSEESSEQRFLEIQIDQKRDELDGRLAYIRRQAVTTVEEQGYTPLYLAMYFLRWSESQTSHEILRAPLLLIPSTIRAIGRSFEISWTTEDIQANYALKVKLEEQGIDFPLPAGLNTWESVMLYLDEVQGIASKIYEWDLEESIYLDFFNFTKITMYKDLNPKNWPKDHSLLDAPLLKLLFDPQGSETKPLEFSDQDLDEKIEYKTRYHVKDADPSQMAAIENVRAGANLIIQGPPGTGKSQTIVNMIAEMLSQGKKVLFVSEKMAALEVVKSRLDEVHLGYYCLELHSRKSSKKLFIEELKLVLGLPKIKSSDFEAKFVELDMLRRHLNKYARAIAEPCCASGKTPFQLIGEREKSKNYFRQKGKDFPLLELEAAIEWSKQNLIEAESAIQAFIEVYPKETLKDNPFYACQPTGQGDLFAARVKKLVTECDEILTSIVEVLKRWEKHGVALPQNWEECSTALRKMEFMMGSSKFQCGACDLLSAWNPNAREKAVAIQSKITEYQERKEKLRSKFKEEAFRPDVLLLLENRNKLFDNWHIILHPIKNHRLSKSLYSLYEQGHPRASVQVLSDFDELQACMDLEKELKAYQGTATALFGKLWHGPNSSNVLLGDFISWTEEFKNRVSSGDLGNTAISSIQSNLPYDTLSEELTDLREQGEIFRKKHQDLIDLLKADYLERAGQPSHELPFSDLFSIWRCWKSNMEMLHDWKLFLERREALTRTVAYPIMTLVEEGTIEPADMGVCLRGVFAANILDRVFALEEALRGFSFAVQENRVEKFALMDKDSIELNQTRLAKRLRENIPILPTHPAAGSSDAFLKRQLALRRNHKSIRTILSAAGNQVLALKPCLMVSPLSVAQFLEPGKISFDVVIFDEASQVRPEDALGAIARGKQVVILGDSNQLPPTNFFDLFIEDEDDESVITDYESILQLCEGHGFPTSMLKWHYRSEHESLIAVSNREFYKNRLVVYPSPAQKNERMGLHFVLVQEGIYDRGNSRTNRIEAQFVAKKAIEHYQTYPEESLGIGTFSIAQCEAVIEELQRLLVENPSLEKFFSSDLKEYCFVKNLETIQGDERDVILISVGYGKDKDGIFRRDFGPLNRDGGERRLNVLITRARKKCVVYSNFSPSEIGETASKGLKTLRIFLEYAQTGELGLRTSRDFDSEFERSVFDTLQSHGIEVHSQVESVGYRIDLAIPHPKDPGRYLLGIECDGRKYHSSRVARERDRLRQHILEKKRGWKIVRIWSSDWYWHPMEAETRLIDTVKGFLSEATQDSAVGSDMSPLDSTTAPYEEKKTALDQLVTSAPLEKQHSILTPEKNAGTVETPTDIFQHETGEGFLVPPLDKLLIPVLYKIYCVGGKLEPDENCSDIQEAYWISVKDKNELESVGLDLFNERIHQALQQLSNQGLVRKTDYNVWEITDQGHFELDSRSLV